VGKVWKEEEANTVRRGIYDSSSGMATEDKCKDFMHSGPCSPARGGGKRGK